MENTKEPITVNDNRYNININDKTQGYVLRLKRLYQQNYNDMESFDEISSQISSTVNNLLSHAISPEVKEEDMDGVIQQVLKIFDKKIKK